MLLLCLKPSCYISLLSFQSTPSIPCLCSSSVPAGHPGFFLVYLFLLLSVSGRIHLLLSASVFFSALFLNTLLFFCCIYCYHLIFYCSHHSLSSYPKDCHVRWALPALPSFAYRVYLGHTLYPSTSLLLGPISVLSCSCRYLCSFVSVLLITKLAH